MDTLLSNALYVLKANVNMAFLVGLLYVVVWIIMRAARAAWKE